MTTRCRYRLLVGAVTVLFLVAPAARAYASDCWPRRPPCANGAITSSSVQPAHSGDDVMIRLSGWSALCPQTPSTAQGYQFGLILYGTDGSWLARLTEYGSLPALQPFTYHVNYTDERPFGPVAAACLAYDYDRRLSCVAVDFAQNPIVVPLSVDDPLVSVARLTAPCGHCVEDPGEQ